MNTRATLAEVRRGRRQLLLIGAIFFTPVLIAFVLYFGQWWRPTGGVNKGELVDPARPLPTVMLPLTESATASGDLLRGKWTWVYIGDGACDARCQTALADTRAARSLLAEKMPRVQRVFFAAGACCQLDALKREHPDLIVARFDNPELTAAFTLHDASPLTAGRIYLVDPLGNLMMSYAPDAPSMGLLEDIKKLLKLSQIG